MKKTKRAASQSKSKKPVVVYTYGVFDLFHVGHLQLLKEAKALGDYLIVGLYTDKFATTYKRLPIIPEDHRAAVLKGVVFVDRVVFQHELHPDKNLMRLKPHILAKGPGAGWGEDAVPPGAATMKKLGGKVKVLKYHDITSTSTIIKQIWKSQQQ